jgi:purine-cytosine permease-like protein
MLGTPFSKIPRIIWSTVSVIIFTVCAVAGQAQLFPIFVDFLSLIGYWIVIWVTITAAEQVIFRRRSGYKWETWDQKDLLPVGIAAFLSFGIGWVAAVLCMDQTYYTGPIAKLVGDGSDVSCNNSICLQ